MSIVTKNPSILLRSHILTISDINLPPSPINLFLIYAVCCVEIKLERTFFNLSERAFEMMSTFNKELNSHFLHNSSHLKPCLRKMQLLAIFCQFSSVNFEKILKKKIKLI